MAKSKQYEKLTELQVELMTEWMASFVAQIAKVLPDDVTAKLKELQQKEESPLARLLYDTMRENQELALRLNRPSSGCAADQDSRFWGNWKEY